MTQLFVSVVVAANLTGCAGSLQYTPPSKAAQPVNSITIARPRDEVWRSSVPEIGKRFFVINNLDKDSGLINVSYTGDPAEYVDCGHIESVVENFAGKRSYEFNGAKADQFYETLAPNTPLTHYRRRMKLEGRVNLIFQATGESETTITANTKYVLTRDQTAQVVPNGLVQSASDTISFNTGQTGSFPGNANGASLECVATGKLETAILSAIR